MMNFDRLSARQVQISENSDHNKKIVEGQAQEVETKKRTPVDVDDKLKMSSFFSSKNKSFFERMSEGGAKIANQVYENLYKIPGVNKVVGKMEIAYNQLWADRHQEKAVGFKEKMNGLDSRINALDQSKKEIEAVIKRSEEQKIPGFESLKIKIQDINRQKEDLWNKKRTAQTKFENVDNKTKLYINERDRVADKLIRDYEKKLDPMEDDLKKLQTFRDQIDLFIAFDEVKHKEQLAKLSVKEKNKYEIEADLFSSGMSEKEIRRLKGIIKIDRSLADGRKKIREEREKLARRKAEIDERIAKVDAKANPYRDKIAKFVNIKNREQIKIDVDIRQRTEVFTSKEEIVAHSRVNVNTEGQESISDVKGQVKEGTDRPTTSAESQTKDKERLEISEFLNSWNDFIKETYQDAGEFVDPKDLISLSEKYGYKLNLLDFEDFKDILGKYLIFKKIPMKQFNESINAFFEKKVKKVQETPISTNTEVQKNQTSQNPKSSETKK